MKIPKKMKSERFVSGARLCHKHKMSATTKNFCFVKKEWPEKAQNVQKTLDSYHLKQA
jgi:hypothetical protein